MKKILAMLFICTFAISAFALDIGVGGYGNLGNAHYTIASGGSTVMEANMKSFDWGLQLVASDKYFSLSVGYLASKYNGGDSTSGGTTTTFAATDSVTSFVTFEALAKFPVALGGFTLVPMAGLEYDLCVGATDSTGAKLASTDILDSTGAVAGFGYYSALSAKVGVGAEFAVSESVVIRPQIVATIGLGSAENTDNKDFFTGLGLDYSSFSFGASAGVVVAFKL